MLLRDYEKPAAEAKNYQTPLNRKTEIYPDFLCQIPVGCPEIKKPQEMIKKMQTLIKLLEKILMKTLLQQKQEINQTLGENYFHNLHKEKFKKIENSPCSFIMTRKK